jgi:CrcB protein
MIAAGFVAAAAIGTVARWQLGERLGRPPGTFVANLAGSFALGLLAGAGADSQTVLGMAGLGAFTTFSAVMVELLDLWRERRRDAIVYLAATLIGGIGLAWLGLSLA